MKILRFKRKTLIGMTSRNITVYPYEYVYSHIAMTNPERFFYVLIV